MAAEDPLEIFVRSGLTAGRSRAELHGALKDAGWRAGDIAKALAKYADTPFTPPVPRPPRSLNARHGFLYAALFTALGISAFHLVLLLHDLVDLWVPEMGSRSQSGDGLARDIRWSVAALLVAGPIFVLMALRTARGDAEMRAAPVRRLATYLALFVSGLFFGGDAVFTIYTLLDGGVTLNFALKAAVLAAVSGAVFGWYLRDAEAASDER